MAAGRLSCCWTLVHLDHRPEERKLRSWSIIEENGTKRQQFKFPFLQPVSARSPNHAFSTWPETHEIRNFELSGIGSNFIVQRSQGYHPTQKNEIFLLRRVPGRQEAIQGAKCRKKNYGNVKVGRNKNEKN